MKIKARINQHRRDFTADYECEFCGYGERGHGYDDAYFHNEVIPSMECFECGKSSGAVTSAPVVPAWAVL